MLLDEFQQAGQTLLERGEPLAAYDVLADGLTRFPADVRLRQLMALALARTGASRLASEILDDLVAKGHADEETLGLRARTHKDLWADCTDPADRRRQLERAFRSYHDTYRISNGSWSGVNAATMALLLDDRATAVALARDVRARCIAEHRTGIGDPDRYWRLATLGEAALILGNRTESEDWYGQAAAVGARRFGDLASTRRNARLLLAHTQIDGAAIEAALAVPPVVVFVGHLIDRPDRADVRFPNRLAPAVGEAIAERLRRVDPGFGFASAACGSDILFLEVLIDLGAEATVVLPYDRDQFVEDSVAIVSGTDWAARHARVLALAKEIITASGRRMGRGDMSYEYGFLLLDGMAAVRAEALDTELVCLAVWDGKPGDGPGGTATTVARWRAAGRRVEIIDLAAMLDTPVAVAWPDAQPLAPAAASATGGAPAVAAFVPQIVGLMFADAHGFSKLTEEDIPLFVEHFMGAVAREVARSPRPPIMTNTWGDGLYFVFADVGDTGEFALRLCETIGDTNWRALGFSTDLSLRIGLHAGPAYECIDPVTGRPNYLGAHVSRASRIEPITPPGQVYASAAFAALASAAHVRDFMCVYVGQTPLAKGYGTFPTYAVHRRRAPHARTTGE